MLCRISLLAILALGSAEIYNMDHDDDLDVEALVASTESLQELLDCFIDKGPCDEVSGSFKMIVAEALRQACAKCSNTQKYIGRRFHEALQEKLPKSYAEYKKIFDPEDKYFAIFEATVADAQAS